MIVSDSLFVILRLVSDNTETFFDRRTYQIANSVGEMIHYRRLSIYCHCAIMKYLRCLADDQKSKVINGSNLAFRAVAKT